MNDYVVYTRGMRNYLTVNELAKVMGVKRDSIYRWCRMGMPWIPYGPAKLRRFELSAVDAWLYHGLDGGKK